MRHVAPWWLPQSPGPFTGTFGLMMAVAISCAAPPAVQARDLPAARALLFGFVAQQRSFETLSIGDTRPRMYGETAGRADISYLLTDEWAASLSGHVGGSWFDANGFGTSVKIADASWGLRGGLDRLVGLGDRQLLMIGLGFDYGEGRSWLHTVASTYPFAASRSEGPHAFMAGGSVKFGISQQLGSRLQVTAELVQSVYRAHAKDPSSLRSDYNWLGRSLAGSVGLRWVVLRGRRE